jgi:folylpolyglutamate synthase
LFTSPHLIDVRERIRIDGRPVSRQVFGQTYWYLRRRLLQAANGDDGDDDDLPPPPLPGYFRMLTLMALFVFAHHHRDPGHRRRRGGIDAMILEVGMGGRYDATNVVESRKVCGIALLDYDHVDVLGDTLEMIAAEKVGIYRAGGIDHDGDDEPKLSGQ